MVSYLVLPHNPSPIYPPPTHPPSSHLTNLTWEIISVQLGVTIASGIAWIKSHLYLLFLAPMCLSFLDRFISHWCCGGFNGLPGQGDIVRKLCSCFMHELGCISFAVCKALSITTWCYNNWSPHHAHNTPPSLQYHLPMAINFAYRHFLASWYIAIFLTNWSGCTFSLFLFLFGEGVLKHYVLQKAITVGMVLQVCSIIASMYMQYCDLCVANERSLGGPPTPTPVMVGQVHIIC